MVIGSGYVSRVSLELCKGCGKCVDKCQFGALPLVDDRATVDEARCMGCGICTNHCAQRAITLCREPSKGEPLEIHQLSKVT